MSGVEAGACHLCRRPLGATVYVIEGYIGTYVECEWCYAGVDRPAEPELLTDTFEPKRPAAPSGLRSLDRILDKLTGDHADLQDS